MTTFAPLPIEDALPRLLATLAEGNKCVLVAPPGAGKTTRVPLALLDAAWLGANKILVLEPRRLAARGAAHRMAATLKETVGATIGLRARLISQSGPMTRIEVITEGVFTRMVLEDPSLDGVGAVLFDEFHERSLDADLGLALALDAQAVLREDLRILVMSATLNGARVAALLGNAPVIESKGRAFPVETRYLGRDPLARLDAQMTDAIMRVLGAEPGSILAFLPGQGEIRRVAEQLGERVRDTTVHIAPLYGALTYAEQASALEPAAVGHRKVVLATSIAETSLTIEGVRIVIDSGLARIPRYEADVGVTRLVTVRVSKAAADQRRGRAGRTQAGVCYRLWHEPETLSLSAFAEPEILSSDLSSLLLDCAAWGTNDPATLKFLDPPPVSSVAAARAELQSLGALDDVGKLTPAGAKLRNLPLPPRLSHMVMESAALGAADEASHIAAVLAERGLGGTGVDLDVRLSNFARDRSPKARDMRGLARGWAKLAKQSVRQTVAPEAFSTAQLLALAYPERVAKARGSGGQFLLANGRGANMDASEALSKAGWLVVAELQGQAASARILLAAALTELEVRTLAAHDIEVVDELSFDRASASVRARRIERLGSILLKSEPRRVPADDSSAQMLAQGVASLGLEKLPWTKAHAQLRDRVAFLRSAQGDAGDLPDLSFNNLAAMVEAWLQPYLAGKTRLEDISADDLTAALEALVPWSLRQRLDGDVPTHFTAPTGNRFPLDYESEGAPALHIRVQEMFGLKSHPAVAGGRRPLTLHLLSPAHRLIQITRDLPGFWAGSWRDVRVEMRGRYPRHVWPDDPANAAPTARAKPRGT